MLSLSLSDFVRSLLFKYTVSRRRKGCAGTAFGQGTCRGKADTGIAARTGDECDSIFKAGFVCQN